MKPSVIVVTTQGERIPARVPKEFKRPLINGEAWPFKRAMKATPGSIGWVGCELTVNERGDYLLRFERVGGILEGFATSLVEIDRDNIAYIEEPT